MLGAGKREDGGVGRREEGGRQRLMDGGGGGRMSMETGSRQGRTEADGSQGRPTDSGTARGERWCRDESLRSQRGRGNENRVEGK